MNSTNNFKAKFLTYFRWFTSILLGLFAIMSLTNGRFISFLSLLVAALLILPILSEFWRSKLVFLSNKLVKGGTILVLFILGAATAEKDGHTSSVGSSETIKSQFQSYFDKTNENIKNLPPDQKAKRDEFYGQLKSNPIYKAIIDSGVVSLEYMPCFNLVAHGISYSNPAGFALDEKLTNNLNNSKDGKLKEEFVLNIIALSGEKLGGIPAEIVSAIERYKDKYRIYGEKGVLVDGNGNSTEITQNYDLSPIFVMLDPTNKEYLNSFYEAKLKGISEWTNQENPRFGFLASKSGYMAHLKSTYPESEYLLNVDIEVSATKLYSEYEANEVSADEKYKGKKLGITGTISAIGKDIINDPYVSLQIGYLQSVNCYFSKDNIKVISQLSKGQKVTIIGNCAGRSLTDVVVRECELWE